MYLHVPLRKLRNAIYVPTGSSCQLIAEKQCRANDRLWTLQGVGWGTSHEDTDSNGCETVDNRADIHVVINHPPPIDYYVNPIIY